MTPTSRPVLCLSRLLPESVMARIRDGFALTFEPSDAPPDRDVLTDGCRTADALICTLTEAIDEAFLEAAPRLRVIANYAVGVNNIAVEPAKARGIVVTNTPDVLTEATADLTWALLLATTRRLVEGHDLVRSGRWQGWAPTQLLGTELTGKTLGLVGMGRIGQAVARRAAGFRMSVLGHSRRAVPDGSGDGSWRAVSLEELVEQSDVVSLHVPLTPATRHLIGRDHLRRMRRSAILINTARGPVVDEAALAEALRDGRLAGAGLDVYEHEPALHPGLRGLPQVVTLPHLGSATVTTRTRMGMLCVDNVEAVLAGRPALTPVQRT